MNEIQKAIKLKRELDSLRPLKAEDEQRIMQKFRLDWNYHSNNLEGNSLTYGETKALILFGITAQGKPLKDHFEVTGHDEAIKWVMEVVHQERPLNENFIRELHKLILKESYEVDAITPNGNPTKKRVNVGSYKTTPNHVKTKTGEIFRFATPDETPDLMHDLIEWYHSIRSEADFNPILLASEFHYKYIRLHPFDDGNGRTARILMNFILMQSGYPPVIIKTEDKEDYFARLRQADAGILEPFVEYIAENLNHSLEIMIRGAKGESIEEPDDIVKEIALLEQKLNAFNEPEKILKSQEILLQIFDYSVSPFVQAFFKKVKSFANFYHYNEHYLKSEIINYEWTELSEKTTLSTIRSNIHFLTYFKLESKFNRFINEKIGSFDFLMLISIHFGYTSYFFKNLNEEILLEKEYSEILSQSEIEFLINSEMKLHKEFIEMKINEYDESL